MPNSNVEITQQLLDRHQPGKDAKTVLAKWDLGQSRSMVPDVMILTDILYDAFAQSRLRGRPRSPNIDIVDPSFLLKELIYRYLKDVLGTEFISQSGALFDQAKSYRQLSSHVTSDMRRIEREKSFQVLHKDGTKALEAHDQLLQAVYLMGEAKRILHDSLGQKVRDLYASGEVRGIPAIPGTSGKRDNPFRIPMLEDIRRRLEDAQATVEGMDNKELSLRLLRSFGEASVVDRDVEYPVYGVSTIYAYAPIIIDRLLNGWNFDNKPTMDRLAEQMTSATADLRAIKNRFDRLQTGLEP
ncbi:hypothetical protein [Pseudomonas sp. PLMAX]|uniref:hypothetical protein n=1 Tax=Pseudomonas sp. PLMAX TaxID=2201998 RepID=UPI0038B8040C